ncbi:MAG: hypothetical protein A3G24_28360 [Betaproteobacteria bacterium RIFCSPLOWO2_12_FULL_62_13]|nr:MAG: hypothetical protein A3G24_28360 [Betaproteobacteria bacterium RIFCSPLOWO2_12_FULL_62_13]
MKKPARVGLTSVIAAIFSWGASPVSVQAQERYPERSMRLIVPFAAGASTDVMARKLGVALTPLLGQQIRV